MPRKRITLIVIPPNDGQVQEYKLAPRLLWFFGLLSAALVTAFGYYALHFHTRVDQTRELVELGEQNETLERSLGRARRDVNSIEDLMVDLRDQDQLLRDYHEMEPIFSDSRAIGVGGREEPGDLPDDYTSLSIRKRYQLQDLSVRIDALQREALYQQASFQALIDTFEMNKENLRYVPTIWPVVDRRRVWISSKFGDRIDPFTGREATHLGIDLAGRKGLEIVATANGEVAFAYLHNSLGNVIVINHNPLVVDDEGVETSRPGIMRTEYGHLEKILVTKGQRVTRGDVIGLMGNTGRSTGPHLHYAVRYQVRSRGGLKGYKDPSKFLVDWGEDLATGYLTARGAD